MPSTKISVIWSDINHEIVADASGDIKLDINLDSIVTSIDNILGTSYGERFFRPEFGSNLRGFLFENINSAILKYLSRQLMETIERWETRVNVEEVSIYNNPDLHIISVKIAFSVKGYQNIYEYTKDIKGEI